LAGLGVTRLMSSLLYGVKPHDWSTFAGSATLLMLVALAAAVIPARSAMNVDPIEALRQD
jgi:putative ABC transport system permease protein